jgi:hypothetical protein
MRQSKARAVVTRMPTNTGEFRYQKATPTPPPLPIFSNCGKLLHIINNSRINNHLRDQSKTGPSYTVRQKDRWSAHHPKRITISHEKLCPVHRGLMR